MDWTPYFAGMPQTRHSEMFPAIVAALHAGIDYHPRRSNTLWAYEGGGQLTFAAATGNICSWTIRRRTW